jgi:hypothetical protein
MDEFGILIATSAREGDEFDSQVEQLKAPIVQKALKAQRERDETVLQEQILKVLDMSRVLRENKVKMIRRLRKETNRHLSELDKLDKLEAAANTTGDFRALLVALGHTVPGVKGDVLDDPYPYGQ